ncbi:hypothetical protein H4217_005299 [Coemansia sp. RSA 1939]|nr:hypothetical protein H4217_005299 [Coemansia sp. RSA 1939]KAJ2617111.1 hypothetical protein EV177_000718 [Coemansia sp. RSA 1804]
MDTPPSPAHTKDGQERSHTSVYAYAAQNSAQEPQELQHIRESTAKEFPTEALKMISPLQGAFMAHLVHTQKPRRILELGCFTGYSAVWLAHALRSYHQTRDLLSPPRLWTCERDPEVAAVATKNIVRAGYSDTVTVISESADHVLARWDHAQKLDLIFIDANKSAYSRYYDMVLDRDLLGENGQIIVDNVLLHGKVHTTADSPEMTEKSIHTKLHDFNRHVTADSRTRHVLLPVFDGLMLITKV